MALSEDSAVGELRVGDLLSASALPTLEGRALLAAVALAVDLLRVRRQRRALQPHQQGRCFAAGGPGRAQRACRDGADVRAVVPQVHAVTMRIVLEIGTRPVAPGLDPQSAAVDARPHEPDGARWIGAGSS